MEVINKKDVVDLPYVAGFNGKKIGVYAPSLLAAKQKAVEHFRPKKSQKHMVWVQLAEED